MNPSATLSVALESDGAHVLWRESDRVFCRLRRDGAEGNDYAYIPILSDDERSTIECIKRLTHEYELRDLLDPAWALRPMDLMTGGWPTKLRVAYAGGEPLSRLVGQPMDIGQFLRLAISLAGALAQVHARGLIHRDIKPANALVNSGSAQVWLTGFGVASRLPRERQSLGPPELIAGTLAYMAPEQTGRVNRSVDSRSDLYSLGITFYEMLTGGLPFMASDPMEWVHCQIAKQPAQPTSIRPDIPALVSAIAMKLLSKAAEERYQTAAGVEDDLRRCLRQWENQGRIFDFRLGVHDAPDRLIIPERLYGREREVDVLLASFDRVVKSGQPEMVIVSGYSGIGKSAVVNELHRPLVPPRGLFAAGKFDQYKRDIPYDTLAQAFQSLIRPLLSKSEDELNRWRDDLREALGPNGQLMVGLVPELKAVIGEQPPVPTLPPQEAQHRFHLVFRRFLNVFARPDHPLALFLDDLQWLDTATLDLLEDLLTHPDVRHLMLIGAYRSNEVDATHPLTRKMHAMRQGGASLHDIVLAPLTREDLERFVADSLHCDPPEAASLAAMVHDKTTGNPFFAIQFVTELFEEDLLAFDHVSGRWSWDLDRIRAKGYTDNVVDLMVAKLGRLSPGAQNALKQLACLGNTAEFTMVSVACQDSTGEAHEHLTDAVVAGFIRRSPGSYHFLHDRVQEAAYSLIPQELRAQTHLRIGMTMAKNTRAEEIEARIFEIANQLNRGVHLLTSIPERERIAELNLIAGRRAKNSTAYASALNYFSVGGSLLPEDRWTRSPALTFALELHRAECEFLTANLAAAEERLTLLSSRAGTAVEQAAVACLRIDLCTTLAQSDRAVAVCFDYLQKLGVAWSPHPTQEEVQREYQQIWTQLGARTIEALIDLPLMSDADSLGTLDVLVKVLPPALHTDTNFLCLAACRMVNLSLARGNGDGSCFAYVWLGMLAGPIFGDYRAGFRFGRLGYELVEQRGLRRFKAATYMCFGSHVLPWTKHARTGRQLIRNAFEIASNTGDLTFATYCCENLNRNLLTAGDPLAEVQREAETGLAFARKVGFGHVVAQIVSQLALIHTLRGVTPRFGSFDEEEFDEPSFERHLASNVSLQLPACWYWIKKLQARFLANDLAAALDASMQACRLLWTSPSHFETAEFHFYSALNHAAYWNSAPADQQHEHFTALVMHSRQLQVWAENGPENFENRAALVAAEIARIEGRLIDAEHLFEQAISSAHRHGFVHNEAIANEVAGHFYAARGFEKIATTYLRDARSCYLRWGADGKVRHLELAHPHLLADKSIIGATPTMLASVERLDLATVIKLSEAVSGEIVLERLIDTLMRTSIEHAGAERGLLILPRDGDYRIEAEATTSSDGLTVELRQAPLSAADLPQSVLRYALRTSECVLIQDASGQSPFSADEYIRRHQARSLLCLPLLKQTRLLGVLYLENNLTRDAFTPGRMATLRLLASAAAISLENTLLYQDLKEREARVRRLVESNIIGIGIWTLDGRIVDANDALLEIMGYTRSDLASRGMSWMELTAPEWRDRSEQAMADAKATGVFQPFEKEYQRKDGSRVPVLVGGALFDGGGGEGVAFVLDLSKQKQAERALRRSEAFLSEGQHLSQTGTFSWRVATDEVTWSEQLYRIYQLESGAPITLQVLQTRVHPEDVGLLERMMQEARGGVRDFECQYRLVMPDLSIKYLHAVAHAARGEDGQLEYIAAVQDVTARRLSEDALDKARAQLAHVARNTSLGVLTASIAHEINQPLSGIITNASTCLRMLSAEPPNLEGARTTAQRTLRDGDRASNVIRRLRDLFARKSPAPEAIDLNDAAREVVALTSNELKADRVTVHIELDAALPQIRGDRIQLQQVILNLIINAADAMKTIDERSRHLHIVTTGAALDEVRLSVRDCGVGFEPATVEKLFEPFHTTKDHGMGIGLSISRSIIESHGGRLWATTNEGPGATFSFAIPR
jgi:PAS domain S-box-containing protein